jgi:hypothetical protein
MALLGLGNNAGYETGDYNDEVEDLKEIQSKYNDATSRLNEAIEKLNNAQ